MKKELLNILEKSKTDEELIADTIDIVKESKDLDKSISYKVTNDCDEKMLSNAIASYNDYNKEITIYKNAIERAKLKAIDAFEFIGLQDEIEIGSKITVMQYILHELEHAYQHKISKNKSIKTDYAKILRVELDYVDFLKERSIDEFLDLLLENTEKFGCEVNEFIIEMSIMNLMEELEKRRYVYNKFNIISPIERAAQIDSHRCIKDMLKDSDYQNLYNYYYSRMIFSEINGYKMAKSPLIKYLTEIGQLSILDDLSFFKKELASISLSKRLYYGLELFDGELEKRTDQAVKRLNRIN